MKQVLGVNNSILVRLMQRLDEREEKRTMT